MDGATLAKLIETGGPVAAGIAIVLLVLFVGLKLSGVGFAIGTKKSLVDEEKVDGVAAGIAEINKTLGEQLVRVEGRMSDLEKDLERRATRDEMHKLELAFTEMKGRFESIDQRTASTAHAVGRIESFMYEAAMRSRGSDK